MPFVRTLTAANPASPAAALVPRSWCSLRNGRLVSSAAAAMPQLSALSLADVGSEDGDDADALYDTIED